MGVGYLTNSWQMLDSKKKKSDSYILNFLPCFNMLVLYFLFISKKKKKPVKLWIYFEIYLWKYIMSQMEKTGEKNCSQILYQVY